MSCTKTIRVTPAMEAEVDRSCWEIDELLGLIDEWPRCSADFLPSPLRTSIAGVVRDNVCCMTGYWIEDGLAADFPLALFVSLPPFRAIFQFCEFGRRHTGARLFQRPGFRRLA